MEIMMSRKLVTNVLMLGVCSLSVPFGYALNKGSLPVTPTAQALNGTLLTRTDGNAAWVPCEGSSKGTWFKTAHASEAVVSLGGGVQVRMSEGTVLHVESSSDAMVNLDVEKGSLFAAVPTSGKTPLSVVTPSGKVSSSEGSFLLVVANGKSSLEVVQGNATLQGRVSAENHGSKQYASLNLNTGDSAESSDDGDQDPSDAPGVTLPPPQQFESVDNLIAQSAANEQRILQGTVEGLPTDGTGTSFDLVLSDGSRVTVAINGDTKFYDKNTLEELTDLQNGDSVEVVWNDSTSEYAIEVRIGRDKSPIGAQEGTALGLGALGIGGFLALQGDGQDGGDDVIVASP